MVVDTRTREEKRADNLISMISSGAKDPKTLTESSRRVISERTGTSSSTSVRSPGSSSGISGSDKIDTPFGSYEVGNTPFEQLQKQEGSFYESAKSGLERVQVTEKYNPEGLQQAMSEGQKDLSKYPEAYQQASAQAVETRMTEQRTELYQQSALGDLLQAGLFIDTEGGLVLSDKGENLGYQNIYALEEGATWGGAFDFLFIDDKVYMYPEGTRKAIAAAGFDEPVFLESGGEEYLVLQREGGNTVRVASINPYSNRLSAEQEREFKDFLDLDNYVVAPDATFKFSYGEKGFDISATGVKRARPDYDFWPKNEPVTPPPMMAFAEEVKSAKTLEYTQTPLTLLYEGRAAEEMVRPFQEFERGAGLTFKNPLTQLGPFEFPEEVGVVSSVPYMFAFGVEATVKSGVAFGDLLFKSAKVGLSGGKLTKEEREIMASEMYSGMPWLMQAPITATFLTGSALQRATAPKVTADGARLKLQSVRMEGAVPVEEYNLYTISRYHPDFRQATAKLAAGLKVPNISPGNAIKGAADTAIGAVQGQKTMYFLAGGSKQALRQIASGGGQASMYASLTLLGVNPYGAFKPRPQPQARVRVAEPKAAPALPASVMAAMRTAQPRAVRGITPRQYTFAQPQARARYAPAASESRRDQIRQEAILEDIFQREAGRTKFEQVEAVRQQAKVGYSIRVTPITGTMTGTRTGQMALEAPRIGVSPRMAQIPRELMRIETMMRQPPRQRLPPPPPLLLNFRFDFSEGKRGAGAKLPGFGSKAKYTPSLAGFALGKTEKSVRRVYSGFEIRGLKRSKKRRNVLSGVL